MTGADIKAMRGRLLNEGLIAPTTLETVQAPRPL